MRAPYIMATMEHVATRYRILTFPGVTMVMSLKIGVRNNCRVMSLKIGVRDNCRVMYLKIGVRNNLISKT